MVNYNFYYYNTHSQTEIEKKIPPCYYSNWVSPIECPQNYNLVFYDDFNGNALDPQKWHIVPFQQGFGSIFNSLNNVTVANGICTITANDILVQGDEFNYCLSNCIPCTTQVELDNCILSDSMPNLRSFHYTTASLWSIPTFKYGIFEIRCKIPPHDCNWPTFWLYGIHTHPWNEIDIFDGFDPLNEDADILHSLWCENERGYTHCVEQGYRVDITQPKKDSCTLRVTYHNDDIDYSRDFHTYTLDWDEFNGITWYIDGNVTLHVPAYTDMNDNEVNCNDMYNIPGIYHKNYLPYDTSNLIFGLQLTEDGCTFNRIFPSSYQIDYIKIWQRDNGCCISHKDYESSNNLPTITQVDNYIEAESNSYSSVAVLPGQNVTFHAGDHIDLLPTFIALPGSNFTAEIQDCQLNNPGGGDIVINNFPNSFTPNGWFNNELCVSVNNATSYNILVEQTGWPYNSLYSENNVSIYSDPVCVWDGSCNYSGNCGSYVECNKNRKVTIDFKNCDHTLSTTKTVYVDCSNARTSKDSLISQNKTDSVFAKNSKINEKEFYFTISPNPCQYNAFIKYSLSSDNIVSLSFFNYTGEKVKELSFSGGESKKVIDITDLANGIYSYQVYSGNNFFKAGKIVVIK